MILYDARKSDGSVSEDAYRTREEVEEFIEKQSDPQEWSVFAWRVEPTC